MSYRTGHFHFSRQYIPRKQKVLYFRVQMIGLFAGFSRGFIYTKLGNSMWPSIGKIPLNGSPEGLVNTLLDNSSVIQYEQYSIFQRTWTLVLTHIFNAEIVVLLSQLLTCLAKSQIFVFWDIALSLPKHLRWLRVLQPSINKNEIHFRSFQILSPIKKAKIRTRKNMPQIKVCVPIQRNFLIFRKQLLQHITIKSGDIECIF